MKNYFKISLLIFSFALSTNFVLADVPSPPKPADWEDNPGGEGEGDGTKPRRVPIDDYLPLLIISATTIAGIYSYRQEKNIQK